MDAPLDAIQLEIRLDGDTPVGRARDERGHTREFTGWVGLVATIDALLTPVQDTPRKGRTS